MATSAINLLIIKNDKAVTNAEFINSSYIFTEIADTELGLENNLNILKIGTDSVLIKRTNLLIDKGTRLAVDSGVTYTQSMIPYGKGYNCSCQQLIARIVKRQPQGTAWNYDGTSYLSELPELISMGTLGWFDKSEFLIIVGRETPEIVPDKNVLLIWKDLSASCPKTWYSLRKLSTLSSIAECVSLNLPEECFISKEELAYAYIELCSPAAYHASYIYPIENIDELGVSHQPMVGVLTMVVIQTTEQLDVSHTPTHAVLSTILKDYFIPFEQLDVSHTLTTGVLTTILKDYYIPTEQLDVSHSFTTGVLTTVVINYTNWEVEPVDVSHNIIYGALS
jgi:hypothetical protein